MCIFISSNTPKSCNSTDLVKIEKCKISIFILDKALSIHINYEIKVISHFLLFVRAEFVSIACNVLGLSKLKARGIISIFYQKS